MTINLKVPQHDSALKPAITVIGVGGAGGNTKDGQSAGRAIGGQHSHRRAKQVAGPHGQQLTSGPALPECF